MDNSKNILKLNGKFSIEIKSKVGKYILYTEKIFNYCIYFAYLFGVTVQDENEEKMSILELYFMKILKIYN